MNFPHWKLRYSTNLTKSMPGEDVIGFQWNDDGTPKSLLVVEAKNYLKNIQSAVKNANETLLLTEQSGELKLLDFTINQYYEKSQNKKARLISQFLNEYSKQHNKYYLAFIVTDTSLWKDQYFKSSQAQAPIPLQIISFLIQDWQNQQKKIIPNSDQELPQSKFPKHDPKIIDEITSLLDNTSFQTDQKKLSSAALLYDFNIEKEYQFLSQIDPAKIRNAAKSLSYLAIDLLKEGDEQGKNYAKSAALIFEQLSKLRLKKDEKLLAVEYIIESSFLYSIAGYNANSKVLISILNSSSFPELKEIFKNNSSIEFLYYLMLGDFDSLNNSLSKFIYRFPSEKDLDISKMSDEEVLERIRHLVEKLGDRFMAKAFVNLVRFLRLGDTKCEKCVEEYIQKAQKQFEEIGQYEKYNDAFIIKYYLKSLIENSSQKWLRKYIQNHHVKWDQYINYMSTIGKFPLIALWKSQQEALKNELLTNKSIFVSMPTSAGKTKMAEFTLFKNHIENQGKKSVFVVPTRALAFEIENDLSLNLTKMGIQIATIYGGYGFSPADEIDIDNNDVFVLTPEKLDFLLRNQEDFQNKLSLIIIDEVHEAAQHNLRGLRIEFILSRVLRIADEYNIRIIALSAVINNPSDFSQWITKSEENNIKINWQPTDKKFAFFALGDYDNPTIKYIPIDGDISNRGILYTATIP